MQTGIPLQCSLLCLPRKVHQDVCNALLGSGMQAERLLCLSFQNLRMCIAIDYSSVQESMNAGLKPRDIDFLVLIPKIAHVSCFWYFLFRNL